MQKLVSKEEFLRRAHQIHGDLFDYAGINFVNTQTKITISCKKCRELGREHKIDIAPAVHTFKNAPKCKRCSADASSRQSLERRTKKFLERARKVHGNTYDYSQVEYKNNSTDVTIICESHGPFRQRPASHANGAGCTKCANEESSKRQTRDITGKRFGKLIVIGPGEKNT